MGADWLARLVVRRVVWIVVGLAVFALLGALGVNAADPSPDPSVLPVAVSLVDVDRQRIDELRELVVAGFGIVIVLGTATAVAVGLRRN